MFNAKLLYKKEIKTKPLNTFSQLAKKTIKKSEAYYFKHVKRTS